MTIPTFPRQMLYDAFGDNPRMVSAFEELISALTDAVQQAEAVPTVAAALQSTAFLLLGANEALAAGRVLTEGEGIALADDGGRVTVSITDLVPRIEGGNRTTFIVTGETNLILPPVGQLATIADVAAAYSTGVTSFNTRTGAVTLTSGDVTVALTYTPTSVTGLTGVQSVAAFKTGLALVKADVGLGSVDNTADAAKNVLSATKWTTARNFTITGDGAWTVSADGSADVTAALTLATVNASPGSFGGADKTITATVNAKGLATALAETAIAITASQVTDFSEATDDRVAALIQNGTGITWSYNDAAGTLTPTVTITQYTDEMAQDAIGAMIDGTLVYVDGTPLLTRAALNGDAAAAQGSNALTLATVNGNVGSFGSATQVATFTVNAKGLTTAAANVTITPAVGSITGLGTGVATALAVNVGSAGAFVTFNGALGTPSSGTLTNCTFPTLNQNTTGSAAKWTTARNLAGNSVDGSANVAFANKFIVQGTTDSGLSAAQFLGALGTGIVKNTTTTGVLSIAVAGDFPTLNQNTTGSAATLTTPRSIYGNNFDGSAVLGQIIASTYGGTGNGFTKFTGPTTAEKTFTLPNSSETLLYAGGALGTPSSGTLTNCSGLPNTGVTGLGTMSTQAASAVAITGGTEKGLTSWMLGTSTAIGFEIGTVVFNAGSNWGLAISDTLNGGTGKAISWQKNGGEVGWIGVTNTVTAYNTSSDRRLKINIRPSPDAGELIDRIEVVSHEWRRRGDPVRFSFIAQDLHKVFPEAVHEGDHGRAVKEQWGVDNSKLAPLVVAELKSLRARVKALEERR